MKEEYYQEPADKQCNICGNKENLCFFEVKQATCPTGMYFKYVGYVCDKCMDKIRPALKTFQQVWDTREFEKAEGQKHLLIRPVKK